MLSIPPYTWLHNTTQTHHVQVVIQLDVTLHIVILNLGSSRWPLNHICNSLVETWQKISSSQLNGTNDLTKTSARFYPCDSVK